MRARYVFDRAGDLVERKTGEPLNGNMPDGVFSPMVQRDVAYKSPLSGAMVTSRSQRREEMKAHNVREVDPSEHTPVYRKRKNAVANRGEHDPNAGKPGWVDEAPYQRLTRADVPSKIAKTLGR